MPELPDVEVYRRYVDATSLHRTISDVFLREQLVQETSPQTIRTHLRGAELDSTRRHGKHLFIYAGEGWLQLHFGMTGYLDATSTDQLSDHTELLIDFDDGHRLVYVNERKFGSIMWIDDVDEFIEDRDLGPDPLADGRDQVDQRLHSRSGSIKGALMNQSVIAGLGNVYTDEILFQSGIHPESDTGALGDEDRGRLYDTMMRVIQEAIDRGADVDHLPDTWLLPHREAGSRCPRDGADIERIEISGRATYVCRDHQRLLG